MLRAKSLHTAICRSVLAVAGIAFLPGLAATASAGEEPSGAVYLLSNNASANSVLAYSRAPDGTLTYHGTYATGGKGGIEAGSPPPDPLASQGSLVLTSRFLLAVNAGSNDVSMFSIGGGGLTLLDREPSGGTFPVSIAVNEGLVYVLNAGNSTTLPNISGFVIDPGAKRLVALPHSQRPLAGGSTASGAQVEFGDDGELLIVTEKGDKLIDTYRVGDDGYASQPTAHASSGAAPFGFAVTRGGYALVSEAGSGSASSYALDEHGGLQLVSASVSLGGQKAPCWLVATPDGRYAYTANAATAAISQLSVAPNGALTLVAAAASGTALSGAVLDMALTRNGRFLYVRDAGNATIGAFRLESDGSLSFLGSAGIPAADLPGQGIAAR